MVILYNNIYMYLDKTMKLDMSNSYWERRVTRSFFNLSISVASSFSLIRSMAFSDSSSPTRSNMATFLAFRFARETWEATLFFCLRFSLVFFASGALIITSLASDSTSLAVRFREMFDAGDSTGLSWTESWSLAEGEGDDSMKPSSELEPVAWLRLSSCSDADCGWAWVSMTESWSVVSSSGLPGTKLRVSVQKAEKSMSRFSTSAVAKEGTMEGVWERSNRLMSSCVCVSVTFTCTSVLLPTGEGEEQNSGNTLREKEGELHALLLDEVVVLMDVNIVETLLRTQGSCKKSLKSVDSVRKGLSRGSVKPLVSLHSRGEAESMKVEMMSSQVASFVSVPKGEGASEQAPESDWTRGSGLGSWGTVAREDVGVLAVETALISRSTSIEVGGAIEEDTPPSLFNSSSGVRSERNNCMRRSEVTGSLSRSEVSRHWDLVISAIKSASSGGRGSLKSPGNRNKSIS